MHGVCERGLCSAAGDNSPRGRDCYLAWRDISRVGSVRNPAPVKPSRR